MTGSVTSRSLPDELVDALRGEGIDIAPDPRTLAATCPLVFLCLSDAPAVEQVLFGERGLAVAGGLAASLLNTSRPIHSSATITTPPFA